MVKRCKRCRKFAWSVHNGWRQRFCSWTGHNYRIEEYDG